MSRICSAPRPMGHAVDAYEEQLHQSTNALAENLRTESKDREAKRLIQQFSRKLLRLAGGYVPETWRGWVVKHLELVSLAALVRGVRKGRGAPRKLSNSEVLQMELEVDYRKSRAQQLGKPITTAAALREIAERANPPLRGKTKAHFVSTWQKRLSSQLPKDKRRKKASTAAPLRGRRW